MDKYFIILLFAAMTIVGCRQTQPKSDATLQAEAPAIALDNIEEEEIYIDEEEREWLIPPYVPTEKDYKVYKYEYKEPIHGYRVRLEMKKHNPKTDRYFVMNYIFTDIKTRETFRLLGFLWNGLTDGDPLENITEYTPHFTDTDGIITAPYEDFFFADLDFDGQEELIAGVLPQGASQRGVGLFTDIYKIIDGDIVNYTEYFQANSDIFNHIEQYFFTVNTNTKSIMLYSSGGAYNGGWDIYDYKDGDYVYRHYVSVEWDREDKDIIRVSTYPNSEDRVKEQNLIKQFTTTQEEYDKHHWEY